MKASPEYLFFNHSFWAHVKLISERLGYSERTGKNNVEKKLRRFSLHQIVSCLEASGLAFDHIYQSKSDTYTEFARKLCDYLNYRADVIEEKVKPNLMNRKEAAQCFSRLRKELKPKCVLPMNKQKGEKKHHAYLTGIVNMLTEKVVGAGNFEDEPRGLTLITDKKKPIRTLARWMDGAYPSHVDPYAVWEIKEYYDTTTFGSRVADGIYETMLDGEELKELGITENRKIFHYLIVDDRFTWWDCGRSYLCRIMDMLYMGLIDEALFGREVLTRWPEIVKGWP